MKRFKTSGWRSRSGLIVLLVAALVLVAACGGRGAPSATYTPPAKSAGDAQPAAPAPAPKTPIKLRIGVPAYDTLYLHAMVAEQKGYFKEEGLDATLTQQATGGSAVAQLIAAGQLDMALGNIDHAISLTVQGKPAVALNAVDNKNPYAMIITHKDFYNSGEITKLSDIAGKDFGITRPGSGLHKFMFFIATKAGVDPDSVKWIGLGGAADIVGGVKLKRVKAAASSPAVVIPALAEGWAVLLWDGVRDDKAWNDVMGGPLPVSGLYLLKETLDKNPELAQRAANAFVRADRFIETASLDALTDIQMIYTPTYDRKAARDTIELFQKTLWKDDLRLTEKSWNNLVDFLVTGGVIKDSDRAINAYQSGVSPSFLEKAYQTVK